jgi:mRNA-degrading endonuclease toxin of MazEF toxin-antitoxin module
MRWGDVYCAELNPRSGSAQKGRRPVIVVTGDGFNLAEGWSAIIVVPLSTSASHARRSLTTVEIPAGSAGLTRAGIAICHKVMPQSIETRLKIRQLTERPRLPVHLRRVHLRTRFPVGFPAPRRDWRTS